MVNGAQAVGSVSNVTPLVLRASAAADLSTASVEAAGTANAATAEPSDQAVAVSGQAYRYNSFEFSYRQDFGKIVLQRQRPDTGEVVQQFPSEYYLRKYADSERVARSAQVYAAPKAEAQSADSAVAESAPANVAAASAAPVSVAAPPASGADIPSAPALSSGGAAASSQSVNLTI
jgi:hypothetical protein